MRKLFIFFIVIMLLILGAVLGVLNPSLVELNVFLIKVTLPLGVILALTLVVGALLGAAVLSLKVGGLKWKLRKQERINKKQSNQILELKKSISSENLVLESNSNRLVNKEK